MPEPHLRAADADRAAVADALGASLTAGRLTVAEYDERLVRAYAATTYGELAELTVDLPPVAPVAPAARPVPASPALHRRAPVGPWCGGGSAGSSWQAWRTTSAIVLAIWVVTSVAGGELLPFWPGWVIGPWGAVLLLGTVAGVGGHAARRQRLPG